MYCKKCGFQINEGDCACGNCGAVTTLSTKKILRKRAIIVLVTAIILITTAVILVFSLSSNNSYKDVLELYFKAYEKNDPSILYEDVVVQHWVKYMEEEWGEGEAYEALEESIEDMRYDSAYGELESISYKITSVEEATEEEVEEIESEIYYDKAKYVYEEDEFSVTDACIVYVEFTIKGTEGEADRYYPDGLLFIKENGKWRLFRGGIDTSFYSTW